jgi:hypothetical protein
MSIALLLQAVSQGAEAQNAGVPEQLVTVPAFHAGFALLCFINLLCILSAARLPTRLK